MLMDSLLCDMGSSRFCPLPIRQKSLLYICLPYGKKRSVFCPDELWKRGISVMWFCLCPCFSLPCLRAAPAVRLYSFSCPSRCHTPKHLFRAMGDALAASLMGFIVR